MSPTPDVLVERLRVLTRMARDAVSDLDFAGQAVEQLSDELRRAGAMLGVDEPLARRLLSLRAELESHALTASALAGCNADQATAADMIRRGLDAVASGLPERDDPLLARLALR